MNTETYTETYQERKLNSTKKIRKLSLFGFIITNGFYSDFHWTGKWFKMVSCEQELYEYRTLDFDDGWTYSNFWRSWKSIWYTVKINDKEIK
jgi:hypothetical protein